MTEIRSAHAPGFSRGEDVKRAQFINSLVAVRRQRGLSQTTVAGRIGVQQQGLSLWESGTASPRPDHLAAWARALGLEPYPAPAPVQPNRDECGRYRGYQTHKRRREPICDPCRDANTIYMLIYRAARRGRVAQ